MEKIPNRKPSSLGTCPVCKRRIRTPGGVMAWHGYKNLPKGEDRVGCRGYNWPPLKEEIA